MVKLLTNRKPAIARYQLTLSELVQTPPGQSAAITITVEQGIFVFHLDAIALTSIQQAQRSQWLVTVPKPLRAELQYHALLEESQFRRGSVIHLQSGLTFETCWYETSQTPQVRPQQTYQIKAAQTIISLDGDILHQVCKDYLSHPQGAAILDAHCWLMNQLLGRFRSDIARYLDWAVWAIPVLTVGGNLAANGGSLIKGASLSEVALTLATSLSSFIAPLIWNQVRARVLPVILPRLQSWLWQQLLNPDSPLHRFAKTTLRF